MDKEAKEIANRVEAGQYVPRRNKGVVSVIGSDTTHRNIHTYSVRSDYEEKKTGEVTYVTIKYYRFFEDAYKEWLAVLAVGNIY